VVSKYDEYWAERLEAVRTAVEGAAAGQPETVRLTGLTDSGDRQSWSGSAEVCGHRVTRSSMAHAASLGRQVASSGICAPWPRVTFRFSIAAGGGMMTVSQAGLPQPGTSRDRARGATPGTASQLRSATGSQATRDGDPGEAPGGQFYLAMGELADLLGGARGLRDCRGSDGWPRRGVYFFFEPGEARPGGAGRVVRVGTHALTATSQATLWGRLRQHRGSAWDPRPGGGNHRASVFRRHVGAALIRRENLPGELLGSWLDRHGPRPGWAGQEDLVEHSVSQHIGSMPLLWLSVPDRHDRGFVERNSIALTSRLTAGQDPPSPAWLGHDAARPEIARSGLWNIEHIRHHPEPGFLDRLSQLIHQQAQENRDTQKPNQPDR
jgi:hypothetical protein